jgi:hypothetical protein
VVNFSVGKMRSVAIMFAAGCWMAAPPATHAQIPNAPNVLYTATGTFSTPQVSGSDSFRLAGEPFNITVIANSATVPHQHGAGWADYTGLRLKGTVHSALIPTGVPINSNYTFMVLALGNPNYDVFQLQAPVIVIKQTVTITATIHLPLGTITKWTIHPFTAPVSMDATNATVTYSNAGNATTLTVASGTLNAAYPTRSATTASAAPLRNTGWFAHQSEAWLDERSSARLATLGRDVRWRVTA